MNQQQINEAALIEAQILENKELVETIQESANTLSEPMDMDGFTKWLDQ